MTKARIVYIQKISLTVKQDASSNASNHITVTQDAATGESTRIDKGTDSYFELVLKSLTDHIVSLENELQNKQYIIEELFKKAVKALVTASLPIVTW